MSRTRSQSRTQVTLFPFLTVLLCAMGALIFLFLMITQQIRSDSLAAQVIEQQVEEQLPPEEPLEPEPVTPEEPLEPEVVIQEEVIDPNLEWRERLEKLQNHKQKILAVKNRTEKELEQVQAQHQKLDQLQDDLLEQKTQLETSHQIGQEEADHLLKQTEELHAAKTTLVLRTEEAKEKARTAKSQYAIIPYDGQLGTIRRPILIECQSDTIRFMPENIELTADDMEGFGADENPLAAGTEALVRFWNRHQNKNELKGNDPGSEEEDMGEPYVLVIVRPDGAMTYYAVQRYLSELDIELGYELLTKSYDLKWPDLNRSAQEVCRSAVEEALRKKKSAVERNLVLGNQPNRPAVPTEEEAPSSRRQMRFNPLTGQFIEVEPPDDRGFENSPFNPHRLAKTKKERGGELRGDSEKSSADKSGSKGQPKPRLANLPNSNPQERLAALQKRSGQTNRSEPVDMDESLAELSPRKSSPFSHLDSQSEQMEQSLVSETNPFLQSPADRKNGNSGSHQQADLFAGMQSPPQQQLTPQTKPSETATGEIGADPTPWYLESSQQRKATSGVKGGSSMFAGTASKPQAEDSDYNPAFTRLRPMRMEKEVRVIVTHDKIILGPERQLEHGLETSAEELFVQFRGEIAGIVNEWEKPSRSFYWMPYLKFVVRPGGNVPLEQLLQQMPLDEMSYTITYELDQDEVVPLGEMIAPQTDVISIQNAQ